MMVVVLGGSAGVGGWSTLWEENEVGPWEMLARLQWPLRRRVHDVDAW